MSDNSPEWDAINAQAASLCAEWQERLRLRDWEVTCEVVRVFRLDDNVDGEVRKDKFSRTAKIRVVHPDDRNPEYVKERDIETTIVHELLHLIFEAVEPESDSREDIQFEQGINAVADALLHIKRNPELSGWHVFEKPVDFTKSPPERVSAGDILTQEHPAYD